MRIQLQKSPKMGREAQFSTSFIEKISNMLIVVNQSNLRCWLLIE